MQSETLNTFGPYRLLYDRLIHSKAADLIDCPLVLEFELTNQCNARCIMCPPEVHMGVDFLPHDMYKVIAQDGYSMGIRRMNLTGGEPLLDKKIYEKIKFAKEIGYEYVHMFSNGSLLTSLNREKLLQTGLDSFTISVDSAVKEEYESIRKNLKFDTVVQNVKEICRLKRKRGLQLPLIRVNMVALPENKTSRKLFVETFSPHADIVEIIDSHNWAEGIGEDISAREYSQKLRHPCHILFVKAVVDPKGFLKKCSIDMAEHAQLVDLNQVSLNEAWKSTKLLSLKQRMLSGVFDEPGCVRCTHKESWWVDC